MIAKLIQIVSLVQGEGSEEQHILPTGSVIALLRANPLSETAEFQTDLDLGEIVKNFRASELPVDTKFAKFTESIGELLRSFKADTRYCIDVALQGLLNKIAHSLAEVMAMVRYADNLS